MLAFQSLQSCEINAFRYAEKNSTYLGRYLWYNLDISLKRLMSISLVSVALLNADAVYAKSRAFWVVLTHATVRKMLAVTQCRTHIANEFIISILLKNCY